MMHGGGVLGSWGLRVVQAAVGGALGEGRPPQSEVGVEALISYCFIWLLWGHCTPCLCPPTTMSPGASCQPWGARAREAQPAGSPEPLLGSGPAMPSDYPGQSLRVVAGRGWGGMEILTAESQALCELRIAGRGGPQNRAPPCGSGSPLTSWDRWRASAGSPEASILRGPGSGSDRPPRPTPPARGQEAGARPCQMKSQPRAPSA